jgi:hypothetical protein
MADVNTALIAFIGVLAGGYFNNFLGEDYKRFRDGQALAGALAGELESHAAPIPMIKNGLEGMSQKLSDEESLPLPEWPIPTSPMFDENVQKIGLLGAHTAGEVAFVYENLRAFRVNFHQLSKYHHEMPKEWSYATINGCLAAISRAEHRAMLLIQTLKHKAEESYWRRPATRKQYGIALGLVTFLVMAALLVSSPPANTNCTTVFDHAKGVLTTVCK